MNDETLKEEIDTWIRQAYVNGSLDVNNPEPQGSDVCTELVWEAVLKDRERAVREARINEWKLISESLHSAWLTASNFLSESRNRRLNELRGESDE